MQSDSVLATMCVAWLFAFAASAAGTLREARAVLVDLGFTRDEIARVEAGELVRGNPTASSPRELVASFAFRIDAAPASVVDLIRTHLLADVDPTLQATGEIHGEGKLEDFAGATLGPDAAENLSPDERAAFAKRSDPGDAARQMRQTLLARVQAYRAKGLAGIAPYARDGEVLSPGAELRSMSEAAQKLSPYAPLAAALLLDYPGDKPPDLEETFRWREFEERGVPTLHLEHAFLVADGEVRTAVERQFYVSAGYNAAQAVTAFVPTDAGTLVVYVYRTSTDQVAGIGSGIKRSLGNRLLASQLQRTLEKMRTEMQKR
ncbi:MAG TPA: hypothetical protein VFY49_03420 [Myxococcota bacterium]|nr:hypothetical protein [Myxococcota bacterium]